MEKKHFFKVSNHAEWLIEEKFIFFYPKRFWKYGKIFLTDTINHEVYIMIDFVRLNYNFIMIYKESLKIWIKNAEKTNIVWI